MIWTDLQFEKELCQINDWLINDIRISIGQFIM